MRSSSHAKGKSRSQEAEEGEAKDGPCCGVGQGNRRRTEEVGSAVLGASRPCATGPVIVGHPPEGHREIFEAQGAPAAESAVKLGAIHHLAACDEEPSHRHSRRQSSSSSLANSGWRMSKSIAFICRARRSRTSRSTSEGWLGSKWRSASAAAVISSGSVPSHRSYVARPRTRDLSTCCCPLRKGGAARAAPKLEAALGLGGLGWSGLLQADRDIRLGA
jgi:hypothetical protein